MACSVSLARLNSLSHRCPLFLLPVMSERGPFYMAPVRETGGSITARGLVGCLAWIVLDRPLRHNENVTSIMSLTMSLFSLSSILLVLFRTSSFLERRAHCWFAASPEHHNWRNNKRPRQIAEPQGMAPPSPVGSTVTTTHFSTDRALGNARVWVRSASHSHPNG